MDNTKPLSPFFQKSANSHSAAIRGNPSVIGKTLERPFRPFNPNLLKMNSVSNISCPNTVNIAIVSGTNLPLACPIPILV